MIKYGKIVKRTEGGVIASFLVKIMRLQRQLEKLLLKYQIVEK